MTETQLNHPARTWLRDVYMTQPGMTKTKAAEELGISHKVLNALIEGNYTGNADNQLAKLDEQRCRISARYAHPGHTPGQYIPTELGARVMKACDYAKIMHKINVVYGASQVGKTTAAREYLRRYPDTTILLQLFPKPTISSVLRDLADAMHLPGSHRSMADTLREIRRALSPRHLIIVDEAHLALDRQQGADALDVVRRLFDLSGCAVVLLVTDLDGSAIKNSPHRAQLDQLSRRGLMEVLDPVPCRDDVRAIWSAFNLGEPDAETYRIVIALAKNNCFGSLISYIEIAAAEARQEGCSIDWSHFNHALLRMSHHSF